MGDQLHSRRSEIQIRAHDVLRQIRKLCGERVNQRLQEKSVSIRDECMKEHTTVLSWLLIESGDRGRAGGAVSQIKGKPKLVSLYNFWLTGLCIECVSERGRGREANMLRRLISIVLHVPLLWLEDRRWPGEKQRRGGGMRDGGGGSAGSALRWRKRERGKKGGQERVVHSACVEMNETGEVQ